MAEALVSFMLENLAAMIQQEVSLVVGVKEDVLNLKDTFEFIQALLNDAEQKQIENKAVKLWLQKFKDIVYDMDDVLDEWSYEMHKSQNDSGEGNAKKKVISSCLCFCFSNKVAFRHNIGTKIKDIKKRLDGVKTLDEYGFVVRKSDEKPLMRPKTSSFLDVSDIVGRVKDTETIINKLKFLGESSAQALHAPNIISIVGMGGLGKTTLAQLVYKDDQVKTHFDKTMWVCVSEPFNLVTVTKSIIIEANCEVPDSSEWDDKLHSSLIDSLKGKRYLLVLDDVWTEDRTIWEKLELSFKHGAEGSRILVTTRNKRVALMMKASHIHSLEELSDNDCSILLNHMALDGRNVENHEELKKIGEEISKKCKGIPLAAKTLGSLLRFKESKREWSHVLESEIWELGDAENEYLMPSLLLSYYDLPIPLKGCFLYCSIFPKDRVIEKDLLVKLWMAQGFLNKSTSGNEDLEAKGEVYFKNLAMRSFFQDFTKNDDGDIISCKMHDHIHDLAQSLTMNECFVKRNNDTQILDSGSRVRHLTLACQEAENSTSALLNAKKLRTLQILNGYRIKEAPADLFHRFRCLKVLCLSYIGLENLSGEIGNLIHLRYLDLSNNFDLKILPETISNLYNLQTLNLWACFHLCKLPREIWRMINLRHLDLTDTDELSHIPQGIGGLTCLRTLSDFIVGGGGASEGCRIGELKNLKHLQGSLRIKGLGRVETVNEASENVLKQKNLHSLWLGFEHNEEAEENRQTSLSKRMEDVLDVLEPHPDVVELTVYDYLGFKLSRWMESTSIHVKTLKLDGCINLTKLPAFGQLPSLEVLEISGAKELRHIGCEFLYEVDEEEAGGGGGARAAFPKLKTLTIEEGSTEMEWKLEGVIAAAFPILPCLRELEIGGFRNSKAFVEILSKISSLEILEIRGEATEFIKYIRHDDDDLHTAREIMFPNLKVLWLSDMEDMEELKIGFQVVMPLLSSLTIENCNKLKAIQVGSLSKLDSLELRRCASLYELGIPNLKRLEISTEDPIHPSLPEAFATTLQATLEELIIDCENNNLTCVPEQVQQLTSLKKLVLWGCGDELRQRCRKDEGEDWRIISHIPNIEIN